MKKQGIITITLALLSLAIPACKKDEPPAGATAPSTSAAAPAPAPVVNTEANMRAAYGFAAQVSSTSEGYVGFTQMGKLWNDFLVSKTWKSIRTNPLFSKDLDDMIAKSASDADFIKWYGIAGDAFGNESFMVFGQGSGEKIKPWMALNDEIRMQQMKTALGGAPENPQQQIMMAVMPYLKSLEVPPMILGFKFTGHKAAFAAELEKAEKNLVQLPPGVTYSSFDLAPNQPFKSIVVEAGKMMPPMTQLQIKSMISQMQPDAKLADEAFQGLITRRVEITWGFAGDYFLVSLGTDHSHLKLVSYAESILSRKEVAVAGNYANKQVVLFSWSGPELLAATKREFLLSSYFARLKEEISEKLSPADVTKLEADLRRLDEKSKAITAVSFTPMVGVSYRDHGLHSEAFGGYKGTATLGNVKFSGVPAAGTFLWMDGMTDATASDAVRAWVEDFVSVAYDNFQRLAVPTMAPEEQMKFNMFQEMAVPKLIDLYRITRDQFAKSLGLESAIAMDLNGAIPNLPQVPPPLVTGGKIPRVAFLSDVTDRAMLAQSWTSYFKLANDIKAMPQFAESMPPGPLPEPKNEVVDGVSLSYFELPMPTGDLLPNVAVTDKTFAISTSRSYSLELSKAAMKAAPAAKPASMELRVNFIPAYEFAEKWLTLAGQYPDLFFKGDITSAAEFKQNEPGLKALLKSLGSFEGMNMRVFQENGLPRISSEIIFNDK